MSHKLMNHFLYIRGVPGTGKITVAKKIEEKLGWKLFWFHDIKNAVFHVVGKHRIPRLMDEVTSPVIKYLLDNRENVIYVRPSPDHETIDKVRTLVRDHKNYDFQVVRLTASYKTLVQRVMERSDQYRITSKQELDEYLGERSMVDVEGEHVIETDDRTPEEVASQIETIFEKK